MKVLLKSKFALLVSLSLVGGCSDDSKDAQMHFVSLEGCKKRVSLPFEVDAAEFKPRHTDKVFVHHLRVDNAKYETFDVNAMDIIIACPKMAELNLVPEIKNLACENLKGRMPADKSASLHLCEEAISDNFSGQYRVVKFASGNSKTTANYGVSDMAFTLQYETKNWPVDEITNRLKKQYEEFKG